MQVAYQKGVRISGAQRVRLSADLTKAYQGGKSIRELAHKHNRSYGFIHRVLNEAGVELRGRGGATRKGKRKLTARV